MQVKVDVQSGKVSIALGTLARGLCDLSGLLMAIGDHQLGSIRNTFYEEGSPAGSWAPLAESTKKNKKYTAGHKLLIGIPGKGRMSGRLLSSIHVRVEGNSVVIGTPVAYAGVHQYGSKDKGMAIGPQARISGRAVNVKEGKGYQYTRAVPARDVFRKEQITNKLGRKQTVTRKIMNGVSCIVVSGVHAHARFQNIPARPYLVFRPEDMDAIRQEVTIFMSKRANEAGLDVK